MQMTKPYIFKSYTSEILTKIEYFIGNLKISKKYLVVVIVIVKMSKIRKGAINGNECKV